MPLYLPSGGSAVGELKAWVNFDGTGTPAIRAGGNVTSITDRGTGTYTVNFTNAMPDTNYSVVGICNKSNPSGKMTSFFTEALNTGSYEFLTVYTVNLIGEGVVLDVDQIFLAFFR